MDFRIVVSRHATFYSPLIATVSAGFLERAGLKPAYAVMKPGERAHDLLQSGAAHVVQSAVSSSWPLLDKGVTGIPVHFALINRRDGFFLSARRAYPKFRWSVLEGRTVMADHGSQPLAMLRYAAAHNGVDWDFVKAVDRGNPSQMFAAFRAGEGDYVHLQGPGALEAGDTVVSVGSSMPEVAFSTVCCAPGFVGTEGYARFVEAFAKAREWVQNSAAAEVGRSVAGFFPESDPAVVEESIRRYQAVGCWRGPAEITEALYEQALNVFEAAGALSQRYPFSACCGVAR
jgi:NitT/TauT family transport system substrate-binding protein